MSRLRHARCSVTEMADAIGMPQSAVSHRAVLDGKVIEVPTPEVTVLASVSDWGAYAIAACLAFLKRDPAVLAGADVYRRICEDTVRSGAIDGP